MTHRGTPIRRVLGAAPAPPDAPHRRAVPSPPPGTRRGRCSHGFIWPLCPSCEAQPGQTLDAAGEWTATRERDKRQGRERRQRAGGGAQ